jgi:hypothetical protein
MRPRDWAGTILIPVLFAIAAILHLLTLPLLAALAVVLGLVIAWDSGLFRFLGRRFPLASTPWSEQRTLPFGVHLSDGPSRRLGARDVQFRTQGGRTDGYVQLGITPRTLELVRPRLLSGAAQWDITVADLPYQWPLATGHLTITSFATDGVRFTEEGTATGEIVVFRAYRQEDTVATRTARTT